MFHEGARPDLTSAARTLRHQAASLHFVVSGRAARFRRVESLGLTGPPGSSRKMFLRARANSIEGGTPEIQCNIIREGVLGLPGEPEATRTCPGATLLEPEQAIQKSPPITCSSGSSEGKCGAD